jgi:hypothetical protein
MEQQHSESKKINIDRPIYGRIWDYLKQFPNGLAQGADRSPDNAGTAAAALISAGMGCFIMMVTHHLTDTSPERAQQVWELGKWIPGSDTHDRMWGSIGTYSGEETILLIGWLVSWAILDRALKSTQVKTRTIFMWMFGLFVAATVMCWHPLFPYLSLN